MVECYKALSACCDVIEGWGLNPACPAHPDYAPYRKRYQKAYQRMIAVADHRIGYPRPTYPFMRDTLAREIEERFGTKPK